MSCAVMDMCRYGIDRNRPQVGLKLFEADGGLPGPAAWAPHSSMTWESRPQTCDFLRKTNVPDPPGWGEGVPDETTSGLFGADNPN